MHWKDRSRMLIALAALCAAGLIVSRGAPAQPGTEADPVVSLSYLEAAIRTDPVVLEGGEEFALPAGRGVGLLEGRCRLSPPEGGQWWLVDVTSGEVLNVQVEMVRGHWYLPIAADNAEGGFVIRAWQTSVVAVPAGAGAD